MRSSQRLFLRQAEILHDPQMRKQFKVLKHHTDPGAQFRQVGFGILQGNAVDDDFSFLEWLQRI